MVRLLRIYRRQTPHRASIEVRCGVFFVYPPLICVCVLIVPLMYEGQEQTAMPRARNDERKGGGALARSIWQMGSLVSCARALCWWEIHHQYNPEMQWKLFYNSI